MIATVFHATNTRDSMFYDAEDDIYNRDMAIAAFKSGGYNKMADFDVKDDSETSLNLVYASSQNIDSAWRTIPCRSTSVGDIVEVNGNLWIVARFGFEMLSDSAFELTLMKNVM